MIEKSGHKIISRSAGLADGNGFGSSVLCANALLSQGRALRDDKSNSPRVSVDCGKHRKRTWARIFRFICSVSSNRARVVKGDRDSLVASRARRIGCATGYQAGNREVRRNRQDAALAHSGDSGQEMTLFAIRHSLFASLRFAHV